MGINGLMPALKPFGRGAHISKYAGLKAIVDGSCWMHRSLFSCVGELMRGQETDRYVYTFRKYVELLRNHRVTPVIVFDGRSAPAKEPTRAKRHKIREDARRNAQDAMKANDNKKAYSMFRQALEITPEMVHNVIKMLRDMRVEFCMAPYEADPQVVFMNTDVDAQYRGDIVITEDSDILALGANICVCKLEESGDCLEITNDDMKRCDDFKGLTSDQILDVCILAGCDYLDNSPGVAFKTACKLVRQHGSAEDAFKFTTKFSAQYQIDFRKARFAYLHQYVYDPFSVRVIARRQFEVNASNSTYIVKVADDGSMTFNDVPIDQILGVKPQPLTAHLLALGLVHPKEGYPWDASDDVKNIIDEHARDATQVDGNDSPSRNTRNKYRSDPFWGTKTLKSPNKMFKVNAKGPLNVGNNVHTFGKGKASDPLVAAPLIQQTKFQPEPIYNEIGSLYSRTVPKNNDRSVDEYRDRVHNPMAFARRGVVRLDDDGGDNEVKLVPSNYFLPTTYADRFGGGDAEQNGNEQQNDDDNEVVRVTMDIQQEYCSPVAPAAISLPRQYETPVKRQLDLEVIKESLDPDPDPRADHDPQVVSEVILESPDVADNKPKRFQRPIPIPDDRAVPLNVDETSNEPPKTVERKKRTAPPPATDMFKSWRTKTIKTGPDARMNALNIDQDGVEVVKDQTKSAPAKIASSSHRSTKARTDIFYKEIANR